MDNRFYGRYHEVHSGKRLVVSIGAIAAGLLLRNYTDGTPEVVGDVMAAVGTASAAINIVRILS